MGSNNRYLAVDSGDKLMSMSEDNPKRWTADHFSQANPKGPGQDDVPNLLRRVADTIEGLGDVEVLDVIMHTQITEDGDWHNLTVYFVKPRDDEDA